MDISSFRRFEYVPASITTSMPKSFLAVKYRDNRSHKMLWKRTRFNGMTTAWYPDRTIYVGSDLSKTNAIGNVDYDEIMLTGLSTHCQVLKNAGYNIAMASPHNTSKSATPHRNPHVKLYSDSGGFQLLSGAADFIDPVELADLYNKTIDYGIGLDIPVFGNNDLLFRMLPIMQANNKILRKHLRSEVSLFDVSHGSTLDTRSRFLTDVLKGETSPALAIGGIAQNIKDGGEVATLTSGVINLMYTLEKSKGVYKMYHILGTTQAFFQMLYWLIQESNVDRIITADSTSYVLPAVNNLTLANKYEQDLSVSTSTLPKEPTPVATAYSSPVTSMVKYAHYLHVQANVNAVHCLYVLNDNYEFIRHVARQFLDGHISLDALVTYVSGKRDLKYSLYKGLFRFAIDCTSLGFKKAYEKHSAFLKSMERRSKKGNALFGQEQISSETRVRLEKVLTRYEKYHKKTKKGGKHG